MLRRTKHLALAGALVAAAAIAAPAAHASRIGVNLSIGVPGVVVGAPYYPPVYAPAPVYVPPPAVVYTPPRVVAVAPPVRVIYRAPYRYHHHRVFVRGPVYYGY
jgi:hypothetical protein